jgi:CRISPR/Cas system CSM-associated protein Csm4 (group 5 of RAMP superfamily)
MSLEIVDLPQPEAPTNATLEPGLRLIEKFSIRGSARRGAGKFSLTESQWMK